MQKPFHLKISCKDFISGNHIGNIIPEQHIYTNHINAYDPNLSSVARYSPPSPYVASEINAHDVNIHQTSNDITATISEYSSNCLTYNNVIFVPNTSSNIIDHSDSVEMVKNESAISSINSNIGESQSYKYIVSSDPRFLNTFIRNGNAMENLSEIDLNCTVMPVNGYSEQTQHIISAPAVIDENIIPNHISMYQEQNPHNIQHDANHHLHHHHSQHQSNIANHLIPSISDSFHNGKINESEMDVVFQDANGQLYRQALNILLNHNEIGPNAVEMAPTTSITETMVNDVGYPTGSYNINHNVSQHLQLHHVGPSYEIHANMGENIGISTAETVNENQMITNISQNNHSVELIYGNYNDCSHIQPDHNQYTVLEPIDQSDVMHGQHADLMNRCNTNMVMDKDQQRILLETTMSPLCK